MKTVWIDNLEVELTLTEYLDYKKAIKEGAEISVSNFYCNPGDVCDVYVKTAPCKERVYIDIDRYFTITVKKKILLSNVSVVDCIDCIDCRDENDGSEEAYAYLARIKS